MDATIIPFPDLDALKPPRSNTVWLEVILYDDDPDRVGFRTLDYPSKITNVMLAESLRAIADSIEQGNDNDPAEGA